MKHYYHSFSGLRVLALFWECVAFFLAIVNIRTITPKWRPQDVISTSKNRLKKEKTQAGQRINSNHRRKQSCGFVNHSSIAHSVLLSTWKIQRYLEYIPLKVLLFIYVSMCVQWRHQITWYRCSKAVVKPASMSAESWTQGLRKGSKCF